jgi:hypothetical protein
VPDDWLDIRVFPGGEGAFRLYEDDGLSEAYQRGEYEWTTLTCVADGSGRRVLRIEPVEGQCPALPATRAYRVTFVGVDQPAQVEDELGAPLSWAFDPATRSLQVTLPARPKHEAFAVAVQWPAEMREGASASASYAGTPPFAHAVAYTASNEARRQLAQLILVPPYGPDQEPRACDADIRWRDLQQTSATELRQRVTAFQTETMLTAPFALQPPPQSQQWEVEVRFACGDARVTTTVSGPAINPPIQRWRLRYAGQASWSVVQADAAARLTITEPYEVQLDPHQASTAEARVTIELAEATSIWFDTWTTGGLSLGIDEKVLEGGEPRPALAGLTRQWGVLRFGPVILSAGKHIITARLSAPEAAPWVFGVLLADDAGAPLVRCTQVVDEPDT